MLGSLFLLGAQGSCNACVGFAVAAAAQAAVAVQLRKPGEQIRLSVQHLQYCPLGDRFCEDPMQLQKALLQISSSQPVKEDCLKYRAPYIDATALCTTSCNDRDPLASQGQFFFKPVPGVVAAQQAVRRNGGVITAVFVDINHFKDFFKQQPNGVLRNCGAKPVGHAIFLVAYDNDAEVG